MSYANAIYLTTLDPEPDSVSEWCAGNSPLGTQYTNRYGLKVKLFPSGGFIPGSEEAKKFAAEFAWPK